MGPLVAWLGPELQSTATAAGVQLTAHDTAGAAQSVVLLSGGHIAVRPALTNLRNSHEIRAMVQTFPVRDDVLSPLGTNSDETRCWVRSGGRSGPAAVAEIGLDAPPTCGGRPSGSTRLSRPQRGLLARLVGGMPLGVGTCEHVLRVGDVACLCLFRRPTRCSRGRRDARIGRRRGMAAGGSMQEVLSVTHRGSQTRVRRSPGRWECLKPLLRAGEPLRRFRRGSVAAARMARSPISRRSAAIVGVWGVLTFFSRGGLSTPVPEISS
jgi:hypothetical protein